MLKSPGLSALGSTEKTYRAFREIAAERNRQEIIHADKPERDPTLPLAARLDIYFKVLAEEVGELAETFLTDNKPERHTPEARHKEALHVAAVGCAILELLSEQEPLTHPV